MARASKRRRPATGDCAFILHILASFSDDGRAGIVCPQGVLFRGQPEIEEETGDFDARGKPKVRRRKADDEHLIRRALLESRLIDAVISLPLNVFYGAGVPACLLILRKQRPVEVPGLGSADLCRPALPRALRPERAAPPGCDADARALPLLW